MSTPIEPEEHPKLKQHGFVAITDSIAASCSLATFEVYTSNALSWATKMLHQAQEQSNILR